MYLNSVLSAIPHKAFKHLTLTRVVFEFNFKKWSSFKNFYLTLTRVVFEFFDICSVRKAIVFNFNKCCIWIKSFCIKAHLFKLFNFNKCCIWIFHAFYINYFFYTFNFNNRCIWIWRYKIKSRYLVLYLTLTSVVQKNKSCNKVICTQNIGHIN